MIVFGVVQALINFGLCIWFAEQDNWRWFMISLAVGMFCVFGAIRAYQDQQR